MEKSSLHFLKQKCFLWAKGAVNSLGGLNPDTVLGNITGPLHDFWHVLDDEGWVRNWSGDESPVILQ